MRTTLTLDDDVAAMMSRYQKRTGVRAKRIVNEALRRGLAAMETPELSPQQYRTSSVSLGRCLLPSLDDVAEALAAAEGDDFR